MRHQFATVARALVYLNMFGKRAGGAARYRWSSTCKDGRLPAAKWAGQLVTVVDKLKKMVPA